MRALMSIDREDPFMGALKGRARFNGRVKHDDLLFLSGQGDDREERAVNLNDYYGQSTLSLQHVGQHLEKAGCGKLHLLKVEVFMKRIRDGYADFVKAWGEWADPTSFAVLTIVESELIRDDMLVEVEGLAAAPHQKREQLQLPAAPGSELPSTSTLVAHNSLLFVSTHVPQHFRDNNYKDQAVWVLQDLQTRLSEHGLSMQHIVRLTVYMRRIEDGVTGFLDAWSSWCGSDEHLPALTVVEAPARNSVVLLQLTAVISRLVVRSGSEPKLDLLEQATASLYVRENTRVWLSAVGPSADAATAFPEDFYAQAKSAIACLDENLKQVGIDKSRILQVHVYVKSTLRGAAGFNRAWDEWLHGANLPARTTVESPHFMQPNVLIMLEAVAAL